MSLLVLGSRYRVVLLLFIHSICLLLFPFCGCLVLGLFVCFSVRSDEGRDDPNTPKSGPSLSQWFRW